MIKLKLGPIPDDKAVKLTVQLPAQLHRDLIAYGEILGREAGARVDRTGQADCPDARAVHRDGPRICEGASTAPETRGEARTMILGSLKGVGKVYLHVVVDTYGSYAFGFLHVSKQPEAAVAVLHNDVLPFYRNLDLPVKAVLTDNGREFCGTERHPYELYLDLNGIEHRRTKVKSPKTNGFAERFNGTVLDEFFRVKMRETFYETVEALQADLDAWLVHYNTERPHLGYRNQGRRPIETVMSFVSQEG